MNDHLADHAARLDRAVGFAESRRVELSDGLGHRRAQGARVDAFPIDGYCLGIDTPDALARANTLLARLAGAAESLRR